MAEAKMTNNVYVQGTFLPLSHVVESFIVAKRAEGAALSTIEFYTKKLGAFVKWCNGEGITGVEQITPDDIRRYLIFLENRGNNPGGRHAHYRAIKAMLRWYCAELEPNWRNPIEKVKAPKQEQSLLQPIELDDFQAILATCGGGFTGLRDRAILLTLIDCGLRASELLSVKMADLDLLKGVILIQRGKGGKGRAVFFSAPTRKAIRKYLEVRRGDSDYLFVGKGGEPLTYSGLRAMLTRRAKEAGVKVWLPHSFRRGFALYSLRNGVDAFSLQRLLGHSSLAVTQRYVCQTTGDLETAHSRTSPVLLLSR
jgi:site-specific recombinase XerD